MIQHRSVVLLMALILVTSASWAEQRERAQRPMKINKVEAVGLEIWTEYEPAWITDVKYRGQKATFVAQSPHNYYPPSGMTWTHFPGMTVASSALKEIAATAIRTAAENYQVTPETIEALVLSPAQYSQMTGYEATFSGTAHGDAVDVKVFIGKAAGKGIVSLQAFTLKGKLAHLSEQIRRAWQHVTYLE